MGKMRLQHYFDRIGYDGAAGTDFATLAALQEAHVCSVPFENLDVLLGRPLSLRVEEAYEKIVVNSRGGWCYQQNGLFGWVLEEIGFNVTRIAASVMRQIDGAAADATHLCLLVNSPESETRYLIDVGFGSSMIRPIELMQAEYEHPPFTIGLERLNDQYWRFRESLGDGEFSYDFAEAPACEALLAEKSAFQQSHASSHFVLNLGVQMRSRDEHRALRGRVFSICRSGSVDSRTLDSPEALVSLLADEFLLDVPEVAALWPAIVARHEKLFDNG